MAELERVESNDCCSTEAQESCCEPADKAGCCEESAAGRSCGCAAGQARPDPEAIREERRAPPVAQ